MSTSSPLATITKVVNVGQDLIKGAVIGLVLGFAIGSIVWILLSLVGTPTIIQIALSGSAGIVLFSWIFQGGVFKVEPVHNGVYLTLGKRIEIRLAGEGYHWNWPPPIGGFISVSLKRTPLDIAEKVFFDAEGISVNIDSGVFWKVINPFQYLEFGDTAENAKSGFETTLKELVVNAIREFVAGTTASQLLTNTTELREHLKASLAVVMGDGGRGQHWGVLIEDAFITQIKLGDEGQRKAQEAVRQEKKEKESQMIEAEHTAALIKTFLGLGHDIIEATRLAQALTGKLTRTEHISNIQVPEVLVKLASEFLNKKKE